MVINQDLLLDTNIIIAYFKGDENAKELLEKYASWHLPVTVVEELLFGALNSGFQRKNLSAYKEFISQSHVIPINLQVAENYAQIRLNLKMKGNPIPENDIWIAAPSLTTNFPLATRDKHFSNIEGIVIEN